MTKRRWLALGAAMILAGCSGGEKPYVASANKRVMILVHSVERDGDTSQADVTYILARPEPFDSAGGKMGVRMLNRTRFNCAAQAFGVMEMTITFANGETTSVKQEPVAMRPPSSSDSSEARTMAIACGTDRTKRAKANVQQLTEHYLKTVAAPS